MSKTKDFLIIAIEYFQKLNIVNQSVIPFILNNN
ncbi:uncharacterized protein YfkK (UPF0435 family) [Chryseobacterium vietnamense]|jgi:uncharacterized protein YfkK (UPF0435 family)|uniref:Uncharacterized protein YfkK (UPF0435 family) n=1 Tax=Chryseobacterium vietnamense TaxID=866785 RepID=A0ACC6JCD4_9FLAO|nr:uncharacterized protein YfkK (UPF0435 family) [Chryseobacterium vietnamense]